MAILHISCIFSTGKMQGVKKKLGEMATASRPGRFHFHVYNREIESNQQALIYHNVTRLFGVATPLVFRAFRYIPALRLLRANPDSPVVLRYAGADLSLWWLCRVHGNRIYFEHHTKETDEIRLSNWPRIMKRWQLLNERFLGPMSLRYCAGLIAVTEDILDYECHRLRAHRGQLRYVFSNGLAHRDTPEPIALKPVTDAMRLVFVAAQFHPWHGTDRLATLIDRYDGPTPVSLCIIGSLNTADAITLNRAAVDNHRIEIDQHGVLPTEAVLAHMARAHVAIDSLAMDRLNMTMSSTLKSKQYVQAGIPVIGSAIDQDIGADDRVFFAVPTQPDKLDLNAVVTWRRALDPRAFVDAVTALAPRLLWSRKLEDLDRAIVTHQAQRT